jgi:hypothetical protein
MRYAPSLLTLALVVPLTIPAQSTARQRDVERFEISGLPKTPETELEKQIFLLLKVHKKGDLGDASRIHAKLGQYYKELGKLELSDACNRKAIRAWEVASGERSASAGSPGSPPFDLEGAFARGFVYTDADLKMEHIWDFYEDGTFAHEVIPLGQPETVGPRELGWYSVKGDRIRLWQMKPRSDRTFSFRFLGEGGKEGLTLDGIAMKPLP